MSDQKNNLSEDQTTLFTLDQEQINQFKLHRELSKTSSSKVEDFLNNASRNGDLIGVDEMEKTNENNSFFTFNNPFIFGNVDMLNNNYDSESEEVSNFDYFQNNIEIPLKDKNQKKNSKLSEIPTPEKKKSLLNKKKRRDGAENKFSREDNGRRGIARFFFNRYLKNIIEKMEKECECILYFNFFPEKFIFEVVKKSNKHFLDYTIEQLLENRELYQNKDPFNYYSENLKVVEELKSEKNKDILEQLGYNKIWKTTYRDLFKEFLKSDEYKSHIDYLISNKGETNAEKFKYFSEIFLDKYKK
jgi:hypothetical protein